MIRVFTYSQFICLFLVIVNPVFAGTQYENNYEVAVDPNACIPGKSYWGRNKYIEYLVGNSPVIITAPHGGRLKPAEIPNRTWGVKATDTNTDKIAYYIYNKFHGLTGVYPHVVICHLKRTKLDANREIIEAAQKNKWAEYAWYEWHDFINIACDSVVEQSGSGFYIDLHAHGHKKQRLELGYLLSNSILERSDAELNNYVDSSSVHTLANEVSIDFASLIRGESSFGALMEARGFPSIPGPTYPDAGNFRYFSGGYNTRRFCLNDREKISGFQIETNYKGVRDNDENMRLVAKAISESIVVYLKNFFNMDVCDLSENRLSNIPNN